MPMIQCKLIIQVSDSVICCYSLVARLISRYFNFLHADEISALWSRQFRRNRKMSSTQHGISCCMNFFLCFLRNWTKNRQCCEEAEISFANKIEIGNLWSFFVFLFPKLPSWIYQKKWWEIYLNQIFFSLQIYRSLVMRIERFLAKIQIFLINFRAFDLHPKSIPHL